LKRVLLSGITLVALAVGPALAADMPRKAPIMAPAPIFSWAGCYIGGHGGGAWSHQDVNVNPSGFANQAPSPFTLTSSGWIAGGQVGCNAQFGTMVIGGEGDWSSTHLDSSATGPNLFSNGTPVGSGGISVTSNTQWLASVRLRVGITVVPNVLAYATVGPAWQHTNYNVVDALAGGCPNCGSATFSNNNVGIAVGGGLEWAPWSNGILLRGEFLYYDLASATLNLTSSSGSPTSYSFAQGDLRIAVARAGLSFKY
jgi:outer membrane immunogenic protein